MAVEGATMTLAKSLGILKTRKLMRSKKQSTLADGNQNFQYFLVLDFEATCWDKSGSGRIASEIIEFPVVLMRAQDGEILDEFHHYVQPTENVILSDFCKNLTGITQDQVNDGMPLGTVLMLFSSWISDISKKYKFVINQMSKDLDSATFITWSDWDINVCLSAECKRKSLIKPLCFTAWCDLRMIYSKFYNRKPQGLEGALKDVGISFKGRQHSGLCDAQNTAKLAFKLISDGCKISITKHSSDAALDAKMKRLMFDPTLSCLIPPQKRKKLQKKSNENFKTPQEMRKTSPKTFHKTPPMCQCGKRAKSLSVSSGPNAGRGFYACNSNAKRCKFFSWQSSMANKTIGLTIRDTNSKRCITEEELEVLGDSYTQNPQPEACNSNVPTLIPLSTSGSVSLSSSIAPQYFGNVKL